MPVIHRLAHRCEIFWNASRVQPYSRSRVTVGREGISRVPRRSLAYAETGGQSTCLPSAATYCRRSSVPSSCSHASRHFPRLKTHASAVTPSTSGYVTARTPAWISRVALSGTGTSLSPVGERITFATMQRTSRRSDVLLSVLGPVEVASHLLAGALCRRVGVYPAVAWNSSTHKPVMVRPIRTTDAILIVSTLLRTGCYHGTRSVWPRHPVMLVSDDRPVVLVVDNVHDVGVVEDGCDDRVGVIRGDEWFDTDRGPRSARSPDPSPVTGAGVAAATGHPPHWPPVSHHRGCAICSSRASRASWEVVLPSRAATAAARSRRVATTRNAI